MVKLIISFLVLFSISEAKKDFYYSFIDENKNQISEQRKNKIRLGNDRLTYIRRLTKEGKIDQAYKNILKFQEENHLKILYSTADILYAEILYKKENRKFAIKGAELLNKAINRGIIKEGDLLDALRLLVKLEIKINKIDDAKFHARAILNSFDDSLSQAYGKIAQAQIDIHGKRYKKAIKTLYKILVETNSMEVATVVADELYDVYILDKQNAKAYTLATKVLEKNIQYYANDSFLALKKVDKLIKANMPFLAIKILKKLLDNAKTKTSIDQFTFRLANAYMSVRTLDLKYILKAKELYKNLVSQKEYNPYKKEAKMYIDEILMREGKMTPSIIAKKYPHSNGMQEKSMMQELLNEAKDHQYDRINKLKRVYKKIPTNIARRFGYDSMKDLFAQIDANMIEYYLKNDKCKELSKTLVHIDIGGLKKIIKDNKANNQMFECLLEYPNKTTFNVANNALADIKDGDVYLYLEKIALQLNLIDKAYDISQKIDLVTKNKEEIKSKEFLYRFLIYGKMNNKFSMDKFFNYALSHKQYIKYNENNPMIIDFYYQYYLYLIDKHKDKQAVEILHKLYNTQIAMDAFVYSPFVEMKLALESELDDDYKKALDYLQFALDNARVIKPNDLVHIYFELSNIYKKLGKINRSKDMIDKCKNVKDANSLYKKMCDET